MQAVDYKKPLILLFIIMFAAILRVPTLFEPWGSDQGVYGYIATGILEGKVPYKDHIFQVYLTDLKCVGTDLDGDRAVVRIWSMRDNELTKSARLGVGDRVKLRIVDYEDVEDDYDPYNQSALRDPVLKKRHRTCWGELVE